MSNNLGVLRTEEHKDLNRPSKTHIPYAWIVDSVSDLPAIVVTAGDLYKTAYVSTGEVYTLISLTGARWRIGVGVAGPMGMLGLPGSKGLKGVPGPLGAIGRPGQMGPKGIRGEMGPIGKKGPTGFKGELGDAGPDGLPPPDMGDKDITSKHGTIWSKDIPISIAVGRRSMQANLASKVSVLGHYSIANASGVVEATKGPRKMTVLAKHAHVNSTVVLANRGTLNLTISTQGPDNNSYSQVNNVRLRWSAADVMNAPTQVKADADLNLYYSQINGLDVSSESKDTVLSMALNYSQVNPLSRMSSSSDKSSVVLSGSHLQVMTGVLGMLAQVKMTESYTSYWVASGRSVWMHNAERVADREDFFYSIDKVQWLNNDLGR